MKKFQEFYGEREKDHAQMIVNQWVRKGIKPTERGLGRVKDLTPTGLVRFHHNIIGGWTSVPIGEDHYELIQAIHDEIDRRIAAGE